VNDKIKNAARDKRVPLWEIAVKLGVSESTVTRMMRQELPPDKTAEILNIIDTIARGRCA